MSALSSKPYKGTRDWYPEEKAVQNYVFAAWKRVVESYGYVEYGAPLLEPLEVYAAKSGQELVNEQTYQFTDRGDRAVAIRPEMTPSISRMVAARRQELAYPARLYSIAQFMRYERPQRGREREFWQLNADIFGDDTLMADLEILTLASQLLINFGATAEMFAIRINHRRLVDTMMRDYLNLDETQAYAMVKLFDRRDKISAEAFMEQAREIAGAESDAKIQSLLDSSTLEDLPEPLKQSPAYQETRQLLSILAELGITNATFDVSLMRGLDYYTGMVFEVFDLHPDNNRALFGGGRYDGLVGLFGAEPISAVGFAPGYSMTELFLQVHGLLPATVKSADLYLIAMPGFEISGLQLASDLRAAGLMVEVDVTGRKIEKSLKTAEKKSITHLVVFGEREVNDGQLTVRDLRSHTDTTIARDDVAALMALLAAAN